MASLWEQLLVVFETAKDTCPDGAKDFQLQIRSKQRLQFLGLI
jgi:hypothetical protein